MTVSFLTKWAKEREQTQTEKRGEYAKLIRTAAIRVLAPAEERRLQTLCGELLIDDAKIAGDVQAVAEHASLVMRAGQVEALTAAMRTAKTAAAEYATETENIARERAAKYADLRDAEHRALAVLSEANNAKSRIDDIQRANPHLFSN